MIVLKPMFFRSAVPPRTPWHNGKMELSLDKSARIRMEGLFRLPLTFNTNTGRKGNMQILRKERYRLQDVLEAYVPKTNLT